MMPKEEAMAVKAVLPFLVKTFWAEERKAVKKDMEVFLPTSFSSSLGSEGSKGEVSAITSPSFMEMIRVAYSSANSWLWVTMMTSFSLPTSLIKSMT